MKILLLSRYERLGASSRVRMFQYIPYLEEQGFGITVAALFTDDYLKFYYRTGKKCFSEIAKSYFTRVMQLFKCGCYDLLWIEKELFPFLPSWGESLLDFCGKPYVVDYDDAVFHNYDRHPNRGVRFLLGRKIDAVMRNAAMVVVGNDYIAERARNADAKRVEYLPSVIDLDRYHVVSPQREGMFTIGWIGSPSVIYYLKIVESALAKACEGGNARMLLVGASGVDLTGVPLDMRSWAENTEVADIQKFNVGIMPLPDTPWERGKCGFKLIQYMACGIPVVASSIGINANIVEHGVNGYLADTTDEWVCALNTLRENPELCVKMGRAGRAKVEAEYCLQVTAPRMLDLLKGVVRN